jgi:hypothetical protein
MRWPPALAKKQHVGRHGVGGGGRALTNVLCSSTSFWGLGMIRSRHPIHGGRPKFCRCDTVRTRLLRTVALSKLSYVVVSQAGCDDLIRVEVGPISGPTLKFKTDCNHGMYTASSIPSWSTTCTRGGDCGDTVQSHSKGLLDGGCESSLHQALVPRRVAVRLAA